MAIVKILWRTGAIIITLALALGLAGCTSDQDPSNTPIGSVVTGKTDSASDYLKQVQAGNEARQQEGQ
jgi:hypothetical protein